MASRSAGVGRATAKDGDVRRCVGCGKGKGGGEFESGDAILKAGKAASQLEVRMEGLKYEICDVTKWFWF